MYSQAFQDEFVDIMLDRPSSGYFVDVGAGCDDESGKGSNSLMFENKGWEGICIDEFAERLSWRRCKKVSCLIGDGTTKLGFNHPPGGTTITRLLADVLRENNCPTLVDYLSIDIDGNDYMALKSFIDAGYSFKVATLEHSIYSRMPRVDEEKRDMFDLLAANGYIRIVDNAGHMATASNLHHGWPFEDWYINPKYVSYQNSIAKIKAMKEMR